MAGFPKTFPLGSLNQFRGPNPWVHALRFGLFPFRSPLLWKSLVVFFSSGYLDVSVHRVPDAWLCIHHTTTEVCSARFPHSEISGSKDICSSPKLFAAYHVFLRLLVPRHPPYALISLTVFHCVVFSLRIVMKLNLDVLFHSVSLCVVFKVPNWWQVINSKLLRNFSIEWFSHSYCFATSQSNNQLILVASQLDFEWFTHSCCFTTFHSFDNFRCQMEITRFELVTSCLQGRRSPNWAIPP